MQLREACPPHKRKDLDKLFKAMHGDEARVMEKIQQWWEDPAEQEEVWEDVSKKNIKKKDERGSGFREGGRGGGRGRHGRGGGGRGGGRDRGRGERGRGQPPKGEPNEPKQENGQKSQEQRAPAPPTQPAGVPVPTSATPALKGAWGARASAAAPATPSEPSEPLQNAPQPKPEDTAKPPESNPLEISRSTAPDPSPTTLPAPTRETRPVARTAVPAGGNVWATKGSAHLIRAEKPKPVPAPVAPPAPTPITLPPISSPPIAPAPVVELQPEITPTPPAPEPTLESGLPPSVASGGAWGEPDATPEPTPIEISQPPAPLPPPAPVEEPVQVAPEPKSAPPPPSPAAPTNVLNLGHWETGDVADSQNLDFGFGSFGADNDVVIETTNNNVAASPAPAKEPEQRSSSTPTVSPARPPPGLSLGGMPPMPESAVMVHELENKMESASLNSSSKKDQSETNPITSSLPTQPMPSHVNPAPFLPGANVGQQSYNQYGMPGMYNYNAAGNGFVGMTPAGPVLAGGVVPQQPGKLPAGGITQPIVPGANAGPQTLPQHGLYGTQAPGASSTGNGSESNTDNIAPAAGIPPGMPGAMPYGNPALAAHYGQHQYYMSQHQGGIGYNYGYGQFGGVAQGGFGYQQVMGQNQGYGAPHYEDHSQPNTHQSGGSGGYHKNGGGGYRGRANHHNNNQYQNQYNPQQHGGYGGQPYAMGYHGDHFNQRGAYGPGGMNDPYAMQPGMHSGGFQDDEHQKGKKGGRGNNSSLQHFQQGPPHQLGGQQGFGLPGQVSDSSASTGAGGWPNNQAGGWSGGAPRWQE